MITLVQCDGFELNMERCQTLAPREKISMDSTHCGPTARWVNVRYEAFCPRHRPARSSPYLPCMVTWAAVLEKHGRTR